MIVLCSMSCASFHRTTITITSGGGGKEDLVILLFLLLEKTPAGKHPIGKLIDIFVGDVPQIGYQGWTSALDVIEGGSVWFELARLSQHAAAAAHEQSDGAFVQLFDGP